MTQKFHPGFHSPNAYITGSNRLDLGPTIFPSGVMGTGQELWYWSCFSSALVWICMEVVSQDFNYHFIRDTGISVLTFLPQYSYRQYFSESCKS